MDTFESVIAMIGVGNVDYLTLGEIEDRGLITLGRGQIISKTYIMEHAGEYPVFSSAATNNGIIGYCSTYMFDDVRLTWSIDGGGKFFFRNDSRYSVTNVCGWLKVNEPDIIDIKYLYYSLTNEWVNKKYDYVHKAHPSVIRNEYELPIPSIEVQQNIVKVLDKFVLLNEMLKKEFSLRDKQMAFYREKLLFGANTKEYLLEEVCQIIDCPHTSPEWKTSGIPVIRNYNLVNGRIDKSNLSYVDEETYKERTKRVVPQEGDILFSREAPIGNVGIVPVDFKCCQGQRVVLLRVNENIVTPQYLVHVIQSEDVKKQISRVESGGSTVSNFNISDLKKLRINVIPLEEQEDVVSTLDSFVTLCSDSVKGLPAEINARNKQFGYYRDKLLNFKRNGE